MCKICTTFAPHLRKRGALSEFAERKLGYGVIGNTTDSGPVIPGSSPGIPTQKALNAQHSAPFVVELE